VKVKNDKNYEFIIGQGNFTIKTIHLLEDALKLSTPNIKFGVAMDEAKPRLTRIEGNDEELKKLAGELALEIGGGHVFVIFMKNAFPIHVLNYIKQIPTVVNIYVATSNKCEVLVEDTSLGSAIIGVVDGESSNAIEDESQRAERERVLKMIYP
jgi:adenosine/AMP kinase